MCTTAQNYFLLNYFYFFSATQNFVYSCIFLFGFRISVFPDQRSLVYFSCLLLRFENLKIFPVKFFRRAGSYAFLAVGTFTEISAYHNSVFFVNCYGIIWADFDTFFALGAIHNHSHICPDSFQHIESFFSKNRNISLYTFLNNGVIYRIIEIWQALSF